MEYQSGSYKETLIKILEKYLSIFYEKYQKLDFCEQQKIIEDIRKKQRIANEDSLQVRRSNLKNRKIF